MDNKIIHQHGDVILKSAMIPSNAKKVILLEGVQGVVLHKGEGTNTHELVGKEFCAYEQEGVLYLDVTEPTDLVHQEHGAQVVQPGKYELVIEREFDYESMEERKTID